MVPGKSAPVPPLKLQDQAEFALFRADTSAGLYPLAYIGLELVAHDCSIGRSDAVMSRRGWVNTGTGIPASTCDKGASSSSSSSGRMLWTCSQKQHWWHGKIAVQHRSTTSAEVGFVSAAFLSVYTMS